MESFCETLLRAYIDELKKQPAAAGTRKEFNDPIWGTIVLYPLEVVVLDSPLLQRLRRIRQLGVAHWIYPGATHTRLEHTLGVVHQVSRLIASVNSIRPSHDFIDPMMARLLRITGLCHDIGHGMLSHVSEKALENHPGTESLKLAFADEIGKEKAPLSEIAAYYIIGTPAFSELLHEAERVTDDRVLPRDSHLLMKNVIIGKPIADNMPLLHELISGPFDADKLDYMARDAFMAGVPGVTDVSRLVQKIRAVDVPQANLPREIAETVEQGHANYTVIGIDRSGGRTLD